MSKDRKLLGTPGSQQKMDSSDLYQTNHNLPMQLGDQRNPQVLEQEDDRGQVQ